MNGVQKQVEDGPVEEVGVSGDPDLPTQPGIENPHADAHFRVPADQGHAVASHGSEIDLPRVPHAQG